MSGPPPCPIGAPRPARSPSPGTCKGRRVLSRPFSFDSDRLVLAEKPLLELAYGIGAAVSFDHDVLDSLGNPVQRQDCGARRLDSGVRESPACANADNFERHSPVLAPKGLKGVFLLRNSLRYVSCPCPFFPATFKMMHYLATAS